MMFGSLKPLFSAFDAREHGINFESITRGACADMPTEEYDGPDDAEEECDVGE